MVLKAYWQNVILVSSNCFQVLFRLGNCCISIFIIDLEWHERQNFISWHFFCLQFTVNSSYLYQASWVLKSFHAWSAWLVSVLVTALGCFVPALINVLPCSTKSDLETLATSVKMQSAIPFPTSYPISIVWCFCYGYCVFQSSNFIYETLSLFHVVLYRPLLLLIISLPYQRFCTPPLWQ